ncbi:anti-anti-sigma factor [Streptomyces sp. DvalAA-14]|uniref:STAS domain-containing protein n=1 Tax=unclassified Streptomyces TaxID=2593676 RepID=UPI00081B8281|nr:MULTISPECIES: STAS domain-containing protein [unclassified Streptomyces]MYS23532.1 STAS domain-containing protein [Streptomyces sp. SID4948]SCE34846.1 anti-anti-sigma factor [Streptomyces sp. DvalAA-14]
MTSLLSFVTRRGTDGGAVLAALGEIDMSNVDTFRSALAEAIPAGGTLRVDLTDVHYLDSAGLAVLFDHAPRISLIAGALLEPVLTISGLTEIVTVEIPGRTA